MPDSKPISQLTSAEQTSANDLFESAIPAPSGVVSSTGYVSRKVSATDMADLILNKMRYSSELQTESKTILGAINEAAQTGGGGGGVTPEEVAEIIAELKTPKDATITSGIASFECVEDNYVKALSVSIKPVQSGSGTPSPDNVRPIVGHDEVVIQNTGKNLLGGSFLMSNIKSAIPTATVNTETNTVRFAAGATLNQPFSYGVKFKENTAYTFIFSIEKSAGLESNIRIYYTDGTYFKVPDVTTLNTKEIKVVTSDSEKTVLSLTKVYVAGYTTVYCDESGIFEGAITSDEYEPYRGDTTTIALPDTIYGGSLEVLSGEGTSEWAMIDSYNGESLPNEWLSDRDVYASGTTPTTGAQVCYKTTATAFSTDPTGIKTFEGENNVFADTGDVTECKYTELINVADMQSAINSDSTALTKVLETGNTSLTFNSPSIHSSSTFDFYTDRWGVNPASVTVSEGTLTLGFEAQTTDISVKVVVK